MKLPPVTAAVLFATAFVFSTPASSDADGSSGQSFDRIITEQTRQTFDRVAAYVREHSGAKDAEQAWQWLFSAALAHNLETDAVELAREYLKETSESPATRGLAQQALALGLASAGQSEEAVELFAGQLRFARFQSGGTLIEFGRRLATKLQMARDFDAAREVYEGISSRFFLNTDIRSLCETRLARIDLVDQPAPEINGLDMNGENIDLTSLQGKVVLVDFWATNCPPCLEEMPNIKSIYSDYRDRGFEVIGVSLDFDASVVEQFTQRTGITWRMIVDEATVEGLRASYHVPKIPALFIIDQSGNLHQFDVRGKDLRTTIKTLIEN